jgi:FMN phosphatase YigB (HAD superfamily)
MLLSGKEIDFRHIHGVIFDVMDTLLQRTDPADTLRRWAAHDTVGVDPGTAVAAMRQMEIVCGRGEMPGYAGRMAWTQGLLASRGRCSGPELEQAFELLATMRRRDMQPYPMVPALLELLCFQERPTALLSILSHLSCRATLDLLRPVSFYGLSCETGLDKQHAPEAAFATTCRTLDRPPEHCLFVDDTLEYALSARRQGLCALVVAHPAGGWYRSLNGRPVVEAAKELWRDHRVGVIEVIGDLWDLFAFHPTGIARG